MKILIGTGNQAKLAHYKRFLFGKDFELVTPKVLGVAQQPEETGKTLEENAILKAKFYFEKSGLPSIVDDAGFEIPALGNWPGINARRINGKEATDQEIMDTVILRMKDLKGDERKARMTIVVALALSPDDIKTAQGEIAGTVPEKPYEKLEEHFPYRSLLFIPQANKWFYELDEAEENALGYRRAALEKILKHLKS